MRVLIDECVHPRLREAFPEHEVVTAVSAPVGQIRDRRLLAMKEGQFDVLVTIDRGFEFQHNLGKPSFGIVILHVRRNRMEYYRPLVPEVSEVVEKIRPGQVVHVGSISGECLLYAASSA